MHVSVIPGVGPATTERLRRAGIHTVADLESVSEDELVRLLGTAHGHSLHHLGHARDDRPVVAERETKSVSVEGTYDTDLTDRKLMAALLTRQARSVSDRLRAGGLAGRTVTIKVRLHDFTTLNRSTTIGSPTDAPTTIGRLAVALLQDLDTTGGVRLLGVGVSGLADWIQEDLFGETVDDEVEAAIDLDLDAPSTAGAKTTTHTWAPGMDIEHAVMGRGLGVGLGPRRGDGAVRDRRDRAGSGAQLPDRRTRPHTMATGAGRRGYSPGHARTTSLTPPPVWPDPFAVRVVAYAALRELIPVFPVYALLFTDAGLSTGQVSSLFIIWSATHVLLEVPSGAWADTVPRRRLLVLGAALYTGCFALWTAVPTYAAFAGGFVLWGLSGSLVSGTYEAYVYDHLHARAATASYRRVIAAGETSALVLNLVATAAAAPIVAVWGLVGAGWASVLVCVGATGARPDAAPGRAAARTRAEARTRTTPDIGYLAMLRAGLAESLHPRVARAVLLAALVPAFLAFDEYFGLLAVDVGASLTWVPLLVALTVAAQAVGAALAPRLPMHRLGPVLVVAGLLVAAGAAAARPLGFVAVAVGYGALQAAIVVAETDLQHRIEGRARATVTSVSGLLSELGAIGLYAFVALGSAAATTATLIAILSIVVAVGGLVAAKAYPATWRKPTDSPGRS